MGMSCINFIKIAAENQAGIGEVAIVNVTLSNRGK